MNHNYKTIYSLRKTISIEITRDKTLLVRAPYWVADQYIEDFVASKSDWIEKYLSKPAVKAEPITADELKTLAERAAEYLPERVAYFAKQIGVTYGRVTVRCQVTRWGSCSSQGNLSFNCLLMKCPPDVIDYVIIHELCHRKELNHSKDFRALVEKHCPDCEQKKAYLKTEGQKYIEGLRASL